MLQPHAGKLIWWQYEICNFQMQSNGTCFTCIQQWLYECRLTSFVVGQEEPGEGCRINGIKYPPALPAFFGKGVRPTNA